MMCELTVRDKHGDKTDIKRVVVASDLAHEIEEGRTGFGEVGIGIVPYIPVGGPKNTEDDWETTLDLTIDEAIFLRDALTTHINYLQRNPTP